jgi:hypothetical protein
MYNPTLITEAQRELKRKQYHDRQKAKLLQYQQTIAEEINKIKVGEARSVCKLLRGIVENE